MFTRFPVTIAVAFALAVTSPKASSKPLPVTDKLHSPIIVTSLVPILYLFPTIGGLDPAVTVTLPFDKLTLFPVTGTSLPIEASAFPIARFNL